MAEKNGIFTSTKMCLVLSFYDYSRFTFGVRTFRHVKGVALLLGRELRQQHPARR